MNKTLNYISCAVVLLLFSATIFADDKIRKEISTVDDVKEFRTLIVNRMYVRLESGDLSAKQADNLMKRIVNLETRPLPTQEQIDWRKAQKGKVWKKRKFRHKRKA